MYIKFDRTAPECKDNKGSCHYFIMYMAKEDDKDTGYPMEWWFDQNGKSLTAQSVEERVDADWQGLGTETTKFTTGSINLTEREWLAMGDTDEARLRNLKAWAAKEFTAELADNFNKHKLPTEEAWLLKGATPEERIINYQDEVAREVISKYATQFFYCNRATSTLEERVSKYQQKAAAEINSKYSMLTEADRDTLLEKQVNRYKKDIAAEVASKSVAQEERMKERVSKYQQKAAAEINARYATLTEAAKGAILEKRVNRYKKKIAAEIASPTKEELDKICSSANPADSFKAWLYKSFDEYAAKAVWAYDKKGEAEWQSRVGGNEQVRVDILTSWVRSSFWDSFDAKFGEYKATLGDAGSDVVLLKEWIAKTFATQFVHDFKQPAEKGEAIVITSENVNIFFKLEHLRHYKGDDKEVLQGKAKVGDVKPGFNKHIHFVLPTKTADMLHRINPQTKNSKEFNRVEFFQRVERSFDKHFGFKRQYEESVAARLGAKLVAATQANKVNPLSLGKEAFRDRPAEEEGERDELTRGKGKRR